MVSTRTVTACHVRWILVDWQLPNQAPGLRSAHLGDGVQARLQVAQAPLGLRDGGPLALDRRCNLLHPRLEPLRALRAARTGTISPQQLSPCSCRAPHGCPNFPPVMAVSERKDGRLSREPKIIGFPHRAGRVRDGARLHDEASEVMRLLQRGRQLELLAVHLLRQRARPLL